MRPPVEKGEEMSTPRTDAIYDPALLDRGIAENGRTWGWGTLSDMRDLARTLEQEADNLRAQVEQWKAYAERLEQSADGMAQLLADEGWESSWQNNHKKTKETKP